MTKQRVAVIGAGPSGTAVLRSFQSAAKKGAEIPEIVCFEKQADVGGLWIYSHRVGTDQYGNQLPNSMYRYLWSNGPKEALEFADYSFEEHFGKQIPSYPPREVLADYIRGRIDRSDVRKWCRFETAVRDVRETTDGKFSVVSRDCKKDIETTEEFDYVFVCSGHFHTPNVPEFEGFNNFEGRILHAHDFRDATEFKGRDVLIIGTSYSAEDIGSQCYKYGAKSITCSWRTNPMPFKWPENFSTVPLLTKIDSDHQTAVFKDGSRKKIDAIILCTGYQHSYPFLPDSLRLKSLNRLWVDGLDNGIFWKSNPKLMYIGMQDQWFTFNMFDAQAWFARDVVLGRRSLSDRATLDKEFAEWRTREEALEGDEANIRFQADYVKGLMESTDYLENSNFSIDRAIKCFLEWEHNKHENVMTFRDLSHEGAPPHHTVWLKALDDSMATYLETKAVKA